MLREIEVFLCLHTTKNKRRIELELIGLSITWRRVYLTTNYGIRFLFIFPAEYSSPTLFNRSLQSCRDYRIRWKLDLERKWS